MIIVIMVEVVRIELIDRLMFFVRIMKVIFEVSMILIDVCCVMFEMLLMFMKCLFISLKIMVSRIRIGNMLIMLIIVCRCWLVGVWLVIRLFFLVVGLFWLIVL